MALSARKCNSKLEILLVKIFCLNQIYNNFYIIILQALTKKKQYRGKVCENSRLPQPRKVTANLKSYL